MKKTLVYIAPHLSTGGMPQYLFKQIESVINDFDVYCIEWDNVTGGVLVVQRNRIQNILGDRLITLGEPKQNLFTILNRIKPDVVHLQEIPELFMGTDIADTLYATNRTYTIIETSHDSGYDVNNKRYLPDKFLMVSNYQVKQYTPLGVPVDLVEYPIEQKVRTKTRDQALRALGVDPNLKHVINVGLFTPRKNQAEIIEYARMLQHYPIQFHFIGNQADNFKHYWEPLMQKFPPNCKWWGERSDVDTFYEMADLFLFTSRGHPTDMETMPLVLRESLGWKVPTMLYNLPVYMGYFDKYDTMEYLTQDLQVNVRRIAEKVLRENISIHAEKKVFYTMKGEEHLSSIEYLNSTNENLYQYGDAAAQYYATFKMNELEHGEIVINPNDVFVDLGTNIGMSSMYAVSKGATELHCFEPDPELVKLIKKNVPTATIHQYAISDTQQDIELYHWPFNPVNTGPKYTASTVTLQDVLRIVGKKINYLKVDIEGFEETMFDTVTLEECAQIEKLMVEHHNPDSLENFCNKLRQKGFIITYVEYGYQSRIYAKYTGEQMKFTCTIDSHEQKVYYSIHQTALVPVTVSVKDIDSGAVIWAISHDTLHEGVTYWISPTPKHVLDFETNTTFGGVSVEFYMDGELKQTNEFRLRTPTVKKPKLKSINNVHPNYNNYIEFFVDKIYDKYLKGNTYNTVVDLGANIGVWTEYIRHVANVGKVYMVEPNRTALELLRECFEDQNTTIVDKAVSDTNGHLDFFINTDNSLISSLANYSDLNTSYKVETITFRKLMEDYGISHINLIKIDIETGEYALFDSLSSDDFSKIDNIIMEFHTIAGRTYEKDVQPLLDKLKNNGYIIDVVPLHAVGGFIFATKQDTDRNKKLTEILDTTPCPDKRDLASLVNQLYPNGMGVEIGVLRGEYSKLILERWHNGTLYLIDTWRHLSDYIDMNGQDDQYHYDCMVKTAENIKPWQHRAHMLRMDSSLSADMFPDEHFDFIYIDADHSYEGVVKDIEAWWPKIKKGGLFCGDDYIPDNGDIWMIAGDKQTYAGKFGVRQAVTEFSTKHNLKIYQTTNEPYWKQWYTFKPY